jgi:hypothetical protein
MFFGATPALVERIPYHLGFMSCDLEAAMDQLGATFTTGWTEIQSAEDLEFSTADGPSPRFSARTVHSVGHRSMHLEVVQGSAGSIWHTDAVVALHHLAYWSPDVAADVDALREQGWELELTALDSDGRPTRFAYLAKPGLTRIEMVGLARQPSYSVLVEDDVQTHPFPKPTATP